MRDNKGLSLVELIVVILIMGIISGGSAVTMSVVYRADVTRAASKFAGAMQEARILAKSVPETDTVTLKLILEDGNNYAVTYVNDTEHERTLLANDRVRVSVGRAYSEENGVARGPVTGSTHSTSMTYTFKKSTGGILESNQEDVYFENNTKSVQVIVVKITGRAYVKGEKD